MAQNSQAIRIQGRSGRHSLINDCYEPLQVEHNGKPAWVARSVAPRYLFHSGKSRWVISKQLDDGAKCWAFVQDPGNTPSPANLSPWTCCEDDGQWRPDSNVQASSCPMSSDQFVQLRMTLDTEMKTYGLIQPDSLKSQWKRLDYNGNNVVSLAEIDKMVVEMVAGGTWPSYLNSKPALMRAYKKTTLKDGDGDAWVEKKEFHALLLNIFWFGKLFQIFQHIDSGSDRRIDVNEFTSGLAQIGLHLDPQSAAQEFAKIDGNHGGQVLFVEFCGYVRQRVNPDAHPDFDADIVSGEHCGRNIRAKHGHHATRDLVVQKKTLSQFDDVEKKFKTALQSNHSLRKMWSSLDFNGNNIVSLAEIDKWVVESYPILNHKPALMRAYKKTIREGNGDDWVQKKEFKPLLGALLYFNKIFWLFNEVDGDDRRLNFDEFKKCLVILGQRMSDSDAQHEFQQIDRNRGGIILFDEFCHWATMKSCPHAFVDMLQ